MFNKFFKWLFIFSLSRAALTSFLLSVSETTTFSVGLFSVFIFGLPNQFFSPVGTSTFFNCLLALASTSIGTFSLKANNSFFFSDKRSEHTSELQSRGHLVCRLLLENKKINYLQLIIRARH